MLSKKNPKRQEQFMLEIEESMIQRAKAGRMDKAKATGNTIQSELGLKPALVPEEKKARTVEAKQ